MTFGVWSGVPPWFVTVRPISDATSPRLADDIRQRYSAVADVLRLDQREDYFRVLPADMVQDLVVVLRRGLELGDDLDPETRVTAMVALDDMETWLREEHEELAGGGFSD